MPLHREKRVPMTLVAQKAKVSLQTVSRVVNKQSGVSRETRERIQKIIDDLGYRPNRVASAMRGSSRTIGVVGYGLEYYGPSRTIIGVEQEASKHGYSISLQLVQDPENFDAEQILDLMLDNLVDGIVWCIPQIGRNFEVVSEHAQKIATPLIYTDVYESSADYVVRSDNYSGGCMATQHLLDQGHQSLAIITGPQTYASARERLHGWRDVMTRNGLASDESYVQEGDWSADSGARCFRKLVQQHPEVSAIFASNDQMALGAMYLAHEMGKQIPNDLAIVGYDDIPEAAFFRPSLTSVHQDTIRLGSDAVDKIIHVIEKMQMDEEVEPIHSQIPPELVVRHSSLRTQ